MSYERIIHKQVLIAPTFFDEEIKLAERHFDTDADKRANLVELNC